MQANRPDEKPSYWQGAARQHVVPLGTRVVFIELCQASGPLTAFELKVRTLLPTPIIDAALEDLVVAGCIEVLDSQMELRPTRYVAYAVGSGGARDH